MFFLLNDTVVWQVCHFFYLRFVRHSFIHSILMKTITTVLWLSLLIELFHISVFFSLFKKKNFSSSLLCDEIDSDRSIASSPSWWWWWFLTQLFFQSITIVWNVFSSLLSTKKKENDHWPEIYFFSTSLCLMMTWSCVCLFVSGTKLSFIHIHFITSNLIYVTNSYEKERATKTFQQICNLKFFQK